MSIWVGSLLLGRVFQFKQSKIIQILVSILTISSGLYRVCFSGITNATDGSEDDRIHCFKENGPVPAGFARLQEARIDKELVEAANLLEEIDLEQDEENGYVSDASIDCGE
jgi:hypothetical protein